LARERPTVNKELTVATTDHPDGYVGLSEALAAAVYT
jgi:hypothetical protein